MLRPTLALAAVGLLGVVLWKVLGAFVLPFVAGVLGFLLKIALVFGLALLVLWFFRKKKEEEGGEKPPDQA